ncbi:type II toxin-antitoxin system Phd/YefM family antitoxin [Jiangella rhizosphaerae]|uniref:Type II toxin-antitoxin system Phd/YefM family antitoxin n=3 Tax=Jiangellaceae TaxID=1217100 RepID=A0A418KPX7_9ACTN|nr:type II toxin-antitoxin system Phd/YefM family antitoxin [Jiangella rhizosphaerae]
MVAAPWFASGPMRPTYCTRRSARPSNASSDELAATLSDDVPAGPVASAAGATGPDFSTPLAATTRDAFRACVVSTESETAVSAELLPYAGTMSEMPVQDAKDHLSEVISRATSTGEVIYLTDHGERLAAIMPAERAAVLDGLLAVEEFEAEHGPIPADEARKAHDVLVREGVITD